jgi:UPF0755 protein
LRRFLILILVLLLVAGGLAGYAVHDYRSTPLIAEGAAVRLTVEPGTGIRQLSRQLGARGLVDHPKVFALLARLDGKANQLRAGVYEIKGGLTARELLERIARGQSIQEQIRFIEGWTFRQIRAVLDAHPGVRHDTKEVAESVILEKVGAIEKSPEGLFFPDSYHFAAGTSDIVLLRQAYARMRKILEGAWAGRTPDLPVRSPYEALILASVVEKETGRPADRPLIGAVFANRLRIGMRLQSDPTVIYGMGSRFDGNLRRADLEADTPYNTYTRIGLPPTPIAAPGAASIAAVMNPPSSPALYFVARGDGTSEFSSTLDEHNRAVARFQKR